MRENDAVRDIGHGICYAGFVKNTDPIRRVHLFRNGRNQAIRIPREFELPGKEAILRHDRTTGRLILEPVGRKDILEVLASWKGEHEEMLEFQDAPPEPVEI